MPTGANCKGPACCRHHGWAVNPSREVPEAAPFLPSREARLAQENPSPSCSQAGKGEQQLPTCPAAIVALRSAKEDKSSPVRAGGGGRFGADSGPGAVCVDPPGISTSRGAGRRQCRGWGLPALLLLLLSSLPPRRAQLHHQSQDFPTVTVAAAEGTRGHPDGWCGKRDPLAHCQALLCPAVDCISLLPARKWREQRCCWQAQS